MNGKPLSLAIGPWMWRIGNALTPPGPAQVDFKQLLVPASENRVCPSLAKSYLAAPP